LIVLIQVALLVYHQVTTLFDFYPFNGSRHYPLKVKLAELSVNGVLMSLPPIGFAFHLQGLMIFGLIYYSFLLFAELIIWWIPYFTAPSGRWRRPYNFLLSLATSNFEKGDTLDHWLSIYDRLHRGTITCLPDRPGRIVPNLEHSILHAWTLVTALATWVGYFATSR
jgi:hypothetical protein